MARNYAALPHEYLEEMEELSDEEFGRLCRALLRYSTTGEETRLDGPEKVLLRRVYAQERRYQESYERQVQARREAGKRGAAKRWEADGKPMAEDGKAMAADGKAIAGHGEASDSMAGDSKNGQTETETETKTDSLTSDDERDARAGAREPVIVVVREDFLRRVNADAPEQVLTELDGFARELGADVCKRAFDTALGAGQKSWAYIRGILRNKRQQGVKSLSDWDRQEEERVRGSPDAAGGFQPSEERIQASTEWLDQFLEQQRGLYSG